MENVNSMLNSRDILFVSNIGEDRPRERKLISIFLKTVANSFGQQLLKSIRFEGAGFQSINS